jgi:serine/threonine protein kinase
MAPEQSVQKRVEDPYRVEVYSLGIILFRMIFKVYPFATSSGNSSGKNSEDPEARAPDFLKRFLVSSKNVNKVQISPELEELLTRMLAYDQRKRCTLDEVINSRWFQMMSYKLKNDKAVLEKTHKSLF